MYYAIFSGSPQNKQRSTSALLASVAKQVLTKNQENEADIYDLSNKREWAASMEAFNQAHTILFILPLYVEGVPGLFLEFLDQLDQYMFSGQADGLVDMKNKSKGKISFILQGGFEEASQLRTAEEYLSKIPGDFGCEYRGTLVKGGMFGMATMRGEKFRDKACSEFAAVLESYQKDQGFTKEVADQFAGAEYYSKGMLFLSRFLHPLNVLVWRMMGRKYGIRGAITERPYEM